MYAIETFDLTKKYKKVLAVDKLNLKVEKGELFSILGVNGAGKTTTIKMLSCLTRPSSGEALVHGDSVISSPIKVKEKISISPQETAVAANLNVYENLCLIAGVYGYDPIAAKRMADNAIQKYGMEEVAQQRAKTLSGGWKRRLGIAMALITEPEVLFLDEPTLGLDVLARRELWKIIKSLKGKITIILTTHYMEEAEALSDRICVLAKGSVKAIGTPVELKEKTNAANIEDAFIAIVGEEGDGK
ncbi:MAG TPA: ABC transporter ATP-binding protein [Candidatus Izemoplasmatales bacterium]|nr:ABC transporter ATP-binding protein [Candidatus Izemoplasmatales bacterium]